jgi:hypothetical protein
LYFVTRELSVSLCVFVRHFNDHYSIALGVDHMEICYGPKSSSKYNREYKYWNSIRWSLQSYTNRNNQNFLMYEHTDGLNYINTEFSRHDDISSLFKIQNTDKIQINLTEGVGVGLLYQDQCYSFR